MHWWWRGDCFGVRTGGELSRSIVLGHKAEPQTVGAHIQALVLFVEVRFKLFLLFAAGRCAVILVGC